MQFQQITKELILSLVSEIIVRPMDESESLDVLVDSLSRLELTEKFESLTSRSFDILLIEPSHWQTVTSLLTAINLQNE